MLALHDFLRSTPTPLLTAYFGVAAPRWRPEVDWAAPAPDLGRALLRAVDAMDAPDRARVMNDADRICAMADEPGQSAIYAVTSAQDDLDRLANGHARALWTFLHAAVDYEHAEQVRYADSKRYGRMWDGFVCAKGCTVARGGEALLAFERAIAERFRTENVEVEICDRSRSSADGIEHELVQVAVFREGRSGERKAFVDGRVGRLPDRPVLEAALTYEPERGVVEAVATPRENRVVLARMFAEHLLGSPFGGERVPLRRYDLNHLRRPVPFPTDPEDNIEAVQLNLLRLMPLDTQAERVTLECMGGAERSIWQMADDFGERNPLRSGCAVTQARLAIRFRPVLGARGGRILPFTISMPHGCDLKGRTARERLVGEKYLRRWGFLRDA